ncbi:MAG TPA: amino acid adenylation domain-containing protein [Gaiellaceae bacterium]
MAPTVATEIVERARTDPGADAVVDGEGTLSYGELEARSAALAAELVACGSGPDALVGVNLPQSADFVVAALAALRAGAAFLPLDPISPPARLALMVGEAQPPVVVGGTESRWVEELGPRLLRAKTLAGAHDVVPEMPRHPAALAYVFYTSGSTGLPKGVAVTQDAFSRFVAWYRGDAELRPGDRVPFLASVGFDASIADVWPALTAGATLVVAERRVRDDPVLLARWLVDEEITAGFLVTAYAEAALPHVERSSLRIVYTAGETLRRDPRRNRHFRLLNTYGVTEAAVLSTAAELAGEPGRPPIGVPIAGADVRPVDELLRRLPAGAVGELAIGGPCVAREYLRRPALTAERFVPDPDGPPGSRMYLTGDRGYAESDGRLAFVGRTDHQVKIRSFRIELGEIEARLADAERIDAAVVVARGDGVDRHLVAYLASSGDPPTDDELRAFLLEALPRYMVPSRFVFLDELPKLPSGKVDRDRLPEPETAARPTRVPRPGLELTIAEAWSTVLGCALPGAESNFFALGGHSLHAAQVAARLRGRLAIDVSPADLFTRPTLADLAAHLEKLERRDTDGSELPRAAAPAASDQQREQWFGQQLHPLEPATNVLLTLRPEARLDADRVAAALGEVARRHAVLRSRLVIADGRLVQEAVEAVPALERIGSPTSAEAGALLVAEGARPFDLDRELPLRAILLELDAARSVLGLVCHHVAIDGTSAEILVADLVAALEGRPLPALRRSYADYAWAQLDEARRAATVARWADQFAAFAPARPEPTSRRHGEPGRATWQEVAADALVDDAGEAGAALGVSAGAALLAVALRVLGRARAVVGLVVANRDARYDDVIGPFARIVSVPWAGEPDEPLADACARAQAILADVLADPEVEPAELDDALRARGLRLPPPDLVFNVEPRLRFPTTLLGRPLRTELSEFGPDLSPAPVSIALRERRDGGWTLSLGLSDAELGLPAAELVERWRDSYRVGATPEPQLLSSSAAR